MCLCLCVCFQQWGGLERSRGHTAGQRTLLPTPRGPFRAPASACSALERWGLEGSWVSSLCLSASFPCPRARFCLAPGWPWRRKCRAAVPSTKPHCSQQILPGSGAFFSNDSAAREWEGPEPKASGTVTKASGMGSRPAHGVERGREAAGLRPGVFRVLVGKHYSSSGHSQGVLSTVAPQGSQGKWTGKEMGELVSMEMGIREWQLPCAC